MAQKVSTVVTDDLDGSSGAKTVSFGLDGMNYEIDLCASNRAKLERDLSPFITAARRAPGTTRRRRSGQRANVSADLAAVRDWARDAGIHVSERGRISADVMAQYTATHQ